MENNVNSDTPVTASDSVIEEASSATDTINIALTKEVTALKRKAAKLTKQVKTLEESLGSAIKERDEAINERDERILDEKLRVERVDVEKMRESNAQTKKQLATLEGRHAKRADIAIAAADAAVESATNREMEATARAGNVVAEATALVKFIELNERGMDPRTLVGEIRKGLNRIKK